MALVARPAARRPRGSDVRWQPLSNRQSQSHDAERSDAHTWLKLDVREQCLYRGERRLPLTPRALALLLHLVQRPNEIVTTHDLLRAAWAGMVVEDGQVKQFVCALRSLLHDDPATPRFIETVRGCGYRYLGGITMMHRARPATLDEAAPLKPVRPHGSAGTLAGLAEGRRILCLIHADPQRANHWLAEQSHSGGPLDGSWTLHARCAEICRDETYSPLLDSLDALCAGTDEAFCRDAMRRWAPTWALQLPWRYTAAEMDAMRALCSAGTEGRARREFARLVEALAARRPLILRIDDLHDADPASRRLVEYLLMQPALARLCIVVATPSAEEAEGLHHVAMRFSSYRVVRPA